MFSRSSLVSGTPQPYWMSFFFFAMVSPARHTVAASRLATR